MCKWVAVVYVNIRLMLLSRLISENTTAAQEKLYMPLYQQSLRVFCDLYKPIALNEYVLKEGIFKSIVQVCCGG